MDIRVFINERGDNVFEDWLAELSVKARAKIDTRIIYLEATKKENWVRPYFAKLKGCDELYEIIVVFNNIQYRPIGTYGPNEGEFTILIGAIEREPHFDPRAALSIAKERKNLIFSDREKYTDEY